MNTTVPNVKLNMNLYPKMYNDYQNIYWQWDFSLHTREFMKPELSVGQRNAYGLVQVALYGSFSWSYILCFYILLS